LLRGDRDALELSSECSMFSRPDLCLSEPPSSRNLPGRFSRERKYMMIPMKTEMASGA
jgi:hypothetical protein